MKITTEFPAQSEDWMAILRQCPWNVFIYGGEQSSKEERCRTVLKYFSNPQIAVIGVNRQDKRHYAYQLHTEGLVKNYEGTVEFKCALDLALPNDDLHILLDLTSLELDIILNLLPSLLEKKPASLFGLYLGGCPRTNMLIS
jgi:hypothetical protein